MGREAPDQLPDQPENKRLRSCDGSGVVDVVSFGSACAAQDVGAMASLMQFAPAHYDSAKHVPQIYQAVVWSFQKLALANVTKKLTGQLRDALPLWLHVLRAHGGECYQDFESIVYALLSDPSCVTQRQSDAQWSKTRGARIAMHILNDLSVQLPPAQYSRRITRLISDRLSVTDALHWLLNPRRDLPLPMQFIAVVWPSHKLNLKGHMTTLFMRMQKPMSCANFRRALNRFQELMYLRRENQDFMNEVMLSAYQLWSLAARLDQHAKARQMKILMARLFYHGANAYWLPKTGPAGESNQSLYMALQELPEHIQADEPFHNMFSIASGTARHFSAFGAPRLTFYAQKTALSSAVESQILQGHAQGILCLLLCAERLHRVGGWPRLPTELWLSIIEMAVHAVEIIPRNGQHTPERSLSPTSYTGRSIDGP